MRPYWKKKSEGIDEDRNMQTGGEREAKRRRCKDRVQARKLEKFSQARDEEIARPIRFRV